MQSDAAIESMKAAGDKLLATLSRRNPAAIDRAVADYRASIEHVRASGAWCATPALAAAANDMLANVDLLTVRVRDLAQVSAHRLAALDAAAVASGRPAVYRRPSRRR